MSRLLENSTPAERARKCTFAERFDGATNLAKNGGVISGSATWVGNGLQLNNDTSYVAYENRNAIMNYPWTVWSGVIDFTPNWAHNDSTTRNILASTGLRYRVVKTSGNGLRVYAGNSIVVDSVLGDFSAYWKPYNRNIIAWSCVSGTNVLFLNGTSIKVSNTTWTAETPSTLFIPATVSGSPGIYHNVKLYLPSSTSQALTAKDCEVLSAGTTYTYWDSATCIMDGLAANYDPANYRHLDISGRGNHVLLGNGTINGPTKLSAQGYSFTTAQFMTVPLAAWPGTAGTLIMDVSYTSEAGGRPRLWGTDHTSGATYEHRTQLSGGNVQSALACNGTIYSANMIVPSAMYAKHIVAATWGASNIQRGYLNGQQMASTAIVSANVTTPDTKFWLMGYDVNTSGTLRSFVSFAKELSSIQIADATLWMNNLRNKV